MVLAARNAKDDTAELVGEALGCVGLLALTVYFAVVNGWVLSILWKWFVPVLFTGAPVLSIPVAIGIALIVRMLAYVDTSNLQTKDRDTSTKVATAVGRLVSPFVMLFFGWIVHLFV